LFAEGCKKDETKKSVVGYWRGSYSPAAGSDWSWLLRADGTVRVYIGADSATASPKMEGSYNLTSDSTIRLNYSVPGGLPVSLNNCKINPGYTRIEGTDFIGTAFYVAR
jgi:hypothetical protein